MSACKDCGREIDWLQTAEGRYIPVDPEPEFVIEGDGDEHFYTEEEGVLSGRLARRSEVQTREAKINTPLGFVPHWRTCPCRGGFRRRKGECLEGKVHQSGTSPEASAGEPADVACAAERLDRGVVCVPDAGRGAAA